MLGRSAPANDPSPNKRLPRAWPQTSHARPPNILRHGPRWRPSPIAHPALPPKETIPCHCSSGSVSV
jgi:hypothetical protein